ncbi:MAG TPA: lipid-binding SYLF domain-containing protein [Polyangiaceae bacterium]|nr:lipid-binding SYLF domain-containing protein [Polyangiaceae bacterium]
MKQLNHGPLATALLTVTLGLGLACSRSEPPRAAHEADSRTAQQDIVERSAAAFTNLRDHAGVAVVDGYLERARGVMIFPRLVKASLILGGEGGNGVLVAKGADGNWSNPAFYSLGAPSVGFQIG